MSQVEGSTSEEEARFVALEAHAQRVEEALAGLAERCDRLEAGLRTLADHVDAVAAHSDDLAGQVNDAGARSWDQVAITRRLAIIEDHLNALLSSTPLHQPDSRAAPA